MESVFLFPPSLADDDHDDDDSNFNNRDVCVFVNTGLAVM